jgi:hypothetical protein
MLQNELLKIYILHYRIIEDLFTLPLKITLIFAGIINLP